MQVNYHIMIDDKFIDGFINAAESIATKTNKYIFTFNPPARYVKSELGIFAPLGSNEFRKLIADITPSDKVFVHWYSDKLFSDLKELNKDVRLYLFFWGGDFLEQPKAFIRFNFEPLTKKYLADRVRRLLYSPSYNPIDLLKQLRRGLRWKISRYRTTRYLVNQRREFLQRLNYFCHWNEADLDRLREEYKCNPIFIPFFYDFGFSKLPDEIIVASQSDKPVVWLGNSSTPTNNHLDALAGLAKFKGKMKLICPLSYGDDIYANDIGKNGKEIFGDDFEDLRSFMPIDQYFEILKNISVVVMYHNRTQAAANIFAFLRMGKKVYIKKESTVYTLAVKHGMKVFDAGEIDLCTFEEFIKPLTLEEMEMNFTIVNKVFGEQNRFNYMKSFLNN